MASSVFMNAARLVEFLAELHKLPHKQVEQAIVVVIEPNRARPQPATPTPAFSVTSVNVPSPLL